MAAYNNFTVVTPRELDDEDFDAEYFSRTYKPLSNLPTPPPSSRNSATSSPVIGLDDDADDVDSTLLGPAVHLANLHPPSASITPPSVALVQAMITRADLPLETIALAVCILDSLDSKFSRKWRVSLPLASPGQALNKRHTITSATSLITHIDSVSPEIIILTALVIAFKFTEDCHEPTQYYASDWGRGLWTCDQINTTERCVMEHLGYRIMPLCEGDVIDGAMEDMRRAGAMALRERETRRRRGDVAGGADAAARAAAAAKVIDLGHIRSVSVPVRPAPGDVVFGLGFQMTPVESPVDERSMELGAPQ